MSQRTHQFAPVLGAFALVTLAAALPAILFFVFVAVAAFFHSW
jgi:hypothetical protein